MRRPHTDGTVRDEVRSTPECNNSIHKPIHVPAERKFGHGACHFGCTGEMCDIEDLQDRIRLFDFSESELDPFQKLYSSSSSEDDEVVVQRWKPVDRHTINHIAYRRRRYRRKQNSQKKFDSTKGYPGEGPVYEDNFLDMVVDVMRRSFECKDCDTERCTLLGHGHKQKPLTGKARGKLERAGDRVKGPNSQKMYPCIRAICASDCAVKVHGHDQSIGRFQKQLAAEYKRDPAKRATVEVVRRETRRPLDKYPYVPLSQRLAKRDAHAADMKDSRVMDEGSAKIIQHAIEELNIVPYSTPPVKVAPVAKTEIMYTEDLEDLKEHTAESEERSFESVEDALNVEDDDNITTSDDHKYTIGDSVVQSDDVKGLNIDTSIDDKRVSIEVQQIYTAKHIMAGSSFTEMLEKEDAKDLIYRDGKIIGYSLRLHLDDGRYLSFLEMGGKLTDEEYFWLFNNSRIIEETPLSSDFPGEDSLVTTIEEKQAAQEVKASSTSGVVQGAVARSGAPPPVMATAVVGPVPRMTITPEQKETYARARMLSQKVVTMHFAFPKTLVDRIGKTADKVLHSLTRFARLKATNRGSQSQMDALKLGGNYPSYTIVRGSEIKKSDLSDMVSRVAPGYACLTDVDRMSVLDTLGYTHEVSVIVYHEAVKALLASRKLDASITFRSSGHVVSAVLGRIHVAAEQLFVGKDTLQKICVNNDYDVWQSTVNYVAYRLCLRDAKSNLALPNPDPALIHSVFHELAVAVKPLATAASTVLRGPL